MHNQKILLVKVAGGMGNRMLCTACGKIIGKALNRQVYIDWRDEAYGNKGDNNYFNFFDDLNTIKNYKESDSIYPKIWQGHLVKSVSEMIHLYYPTKHSSPLIHKKFSISPNSALREENILIFWYYTERFQDFQNIIIKNIPECSLLSLTEIKKQAIRSLVLTESIQNQIETFRRNHFNKKTVGIHVRYSDLKTDLNKMLEFTRKIIAQHNYKNIFLATDNQYVLNLFSSRFSNVITTNKWFPINGDTMHQNNYNPNRVNNGIEALIDLYLLASCDTLIFSSRSTFGYVASLISDIPENNIYDLDKYNVAVITKKLIKQLLA